MSTPTTSKYKNVLDKQTLVPLGAACAVVMALMGSMFYAWSYVDGRLATIEGLQRDQNRDIQELRIEVTEDRWTRTDHRLWVAEFRRLNPVMKIPRVEDTR